MSKYNGVFNKSIDVSVIAKQSAPVKDNESAQAHSIVFFENPQLLIGSFICVMLQVGVVLIPQAAEIFKTAFLSAKQWLFVFALCLVPLAVTEIEKIFEHKKEKK